MGRFFAWMDGHGKVLLRMPVDDGLAHYQQAVVRLRGPVSAVRPKLRWDDAAEAPDTGDVPTANRTRDLPLKYRKGEWEVVQIDLSTDSEWKAARNARWVELELDLGQGPSAPLDIDFIVIAP